MIENNGSALGDLVRGDCCADVVCITDYNPSSQRPFFEVNRPSKKLLLSSIPIPRIPRPQRPIDALQPARKPPTGNFSIDIRTGTSKQVNPSLFCGVKERLQVKNAVGTISALFTFQQSPVDVEGDGVEAEGFDFLEDVDVEG